MENFPMWADHILAALVGIVLPLNTAYLHAKGGLPTDPTTDQKKDMYLSGSVSLFIMAFIVMAEWLLLKRTPEEIGLRQPGENRWYWWLALLFIILYIIDIALSIFPASMREKTIDQWKKRTAFLPTVKAELPLYLLMCLSAGVFEEIVFRGFLVTYFYYLFAGTDYQSFWAVIIPSVIFSVSHFYQGGKAVLKILVFAILFGYIFLLSGSLLIVMLLHFMIDAAGGLLSMWLLDKKSEK